MPWTWLYLFAVQVYTCADHLIQLCLLQERTVAGRRHTESSSWWKKPSIVFSSAQYFLDFPDLAYPQRASQPTRREATLHALSSLSSFFPLESSRNPQTLMPQNSHETPHSMHSRRSVCMYKLSSAVWFFLMRR